VTQSTGPEHQLDDRRSGLVDSNRSRPARPRAPGLGLFMNIVRDVPMLPIIVVVSIVLSFTIDGFLSVGNLQNIMRQLSVILIAVTGPVRIGTYRQSPDSSSTRRGASGVLAGAIGTSTELMTSPRRRPPAEAVAAFPLDATFGRPGARTGARGPAAPHVRPFASAPAGRTRLRNSRRPS
jgi:hypothetical protein